MAHSFNPEYKLSYSFEIDFVLVFHLNLIGSLLRQSQTNLDGKIIFSNPESREFFPDSEIPYFPLYRGPLGENGHRMIQRNEPLALDYRLTRPYYRSWVLVHTAKDADYDFSLGYGVGAWNAVGKRWIPVDGNQGGNPEHSKYILTSYGNHPQVIAKEIIRSGRQANYQSRHYWNKSFIDDIDTEKLDSLFDDKLASKQWILASHPRLVGLPRTQLESWVRKNKTVSAEDDPRRGQDRAGSGQSEESSLPDFEELEAEEQAQAEAAIKEKEAAVNAIHGKPSQLWPGRYRIILAGDIERESIEAKNVVQRLPHEPLKDDDWDSYGVQLRTPFFQSWSEGRNILQDVIGRLKGAPGHLHGATSSHTCSLSVNVRIPPPPGGTEFEFDLLTLKHLVFIVTVFESEIDRLMPHDRRVTNPHNVDRLVDHWSNRDGFRDVAKTRAAIDLHKKDPSLLHVALNSNDPTVRQHAETKFPPKYHLLKDIYRKIFNNCNDLRTLIKLFQIDRRSSTTDGEGLFEGMRTQSFSVDLSRFIRGEDPQDLLQVPQPIIVFRQHEGILREDMMIWWAKFCTDLVRYAHRMAYSSSKADSQTQGSGYWFMNMDDDLSYEEIIQSISIFDLLDDMQFPSEGTQYFRRRMAHYKEQPEIRPPVEKPLDNQRSCFRGLPRRTHLKMHKRRVPGEITRNSTREVLKSPDLFDPNDDRGSEKSIPWIPSPERPIQKTIEEDRPGDVRAPDDEDEDSNSDSGSDGDDDDNGGGGGDGSSGGGGGAAGGATSTVAKGTDNTGNQRPGGQSNNHTDKPDNQHSSPSPPTVSPLTPADKMNSKRNSDIFCNMYDASIAFHESTQNSLTSTASTSLKEAINSGKAARMAQNILADLKYLVHNKLKPDTRLRFSSSQKMRLMSFETTKEPKDMPKGKNELQWEKCCGYRGNNATFEQLEHVTNGLLFEMIPPEQRIHQNPILNGLPPECHNYWNALAEEVEQILTPLRNQYLKYPETFRDYEKDYDILRVFEDFNGICNDIRLIASMLNINVLLSSHLVLKQSIKSMILDHQIGSKTSITAENGVKSLLKLPSQERMKANKLTTLWHVLPRSTSKSDSQQQLGFTNRRRVRFTSPLMSGPSYEDSTSRYATNQLTGPSTNTPSASALRGHQIDPYDPNKRIPGSRVHVPSPLDGRSGVLTTAPGIFRGAADRAPVPPSLPPAKHFVQVGAAESNNTRNFAMERPGVRVHRLLPDIANDISMEGFVEDDESEDDLNPFDRVGRFIENPNGKKRKVEFPSQEGSHKASKINRESISGSRGNGLGRSSERQLAMNESQPTGDGHLFKIHEDSMVGVRFDLPPSDLSSLPAMAPPSYLQYRRQRTENARDIIRHDGVIGTDSSPTDHSQSETPQESDAEGQGGRFGHFDSFSELLESVGSRENPFPPSFQYQSDDRVGPSQTVTGLNEALKRSFGPSEIAAPELL